MENNISRAKSTVLELAYCNQFDYFVTFTVNNEKSDRYDLSSCKKKLSRLFDNYKQRYAPNFKYLVIPEFHKDGAIHFHGLIGGIRSSDFVVPDFVPCRNPFTNEIDLIPNVNKYRDWPYYSEKMGYFSCSEVRDHCAVSRYIIKYLTKDLEKLPLNQQAYICSKKLHRKELIFDCDGIAMDSKPDFENKFVAVKWEKDDVMYDKFGIIDAVCSDLHVIDEPPPVPVFQQTSIF